MMKQTKFVLRLWWDGAISTRTCLQQFLTHNHCGCSIPLWLKSTALQSKFYLADRCPWFLRKRLMNALCGREVFHDFMTTDSVLGYIAAADSEFWPAICLKW